MINKDHLSPDTEALATQLETQDDYRLLRRIPKPFPSMPHMGPVPDGKCIAIVDTETTGLSAANDVIIELAIMLCFVDEDGEVVGHLGPFSWLQDPGRELDPRITMVTGLAEQHLQGQKINDKFAFGLLDRADLIVAHNAAFDLGFIERRYPDLGGRAWACSCNEIDWLRLGYEGRSQSALLAHVGSFSDAHRAAADVWALFWLLHHRQRDPGGGPVRTHLQRLIEAASRPSVIVQAESDLKGRTNARPFFCIRIRAWKSGLGLSKFQTPPPTGLSGETEFRTHCELAGLGPFADSRLSAKKLEKRSKRRWRARPFAFLRHRL